MVSLNDMTNHAAGNSQRPLVPKAQTPITKASQRIPINPFSSVTAGGSKDNVVVDLGAGLLRDLVGHDKGDITTVCQNLVSRSNNGVTRKWPQSRGELFAEDHTALMPPYDLAVQLSDRAYNTCYRFNEIIPKPEYQSVTESVYGIPPNEYGLEEYDAVSLLSAVSAMAYAVDSLPHQTVGCESALAERYLVRSIRTKKILTAIARFNIRSLLEY